MFGFGVLAFLARLGLSFGWPFPQCWLRKFTGIPCPSCGATRSLAAWAEWDLQRAFQFNPLFFCVCVAVAAWLLLNLIERCLGRTLLPQFRHSLRQWPWWKLGFGLLAANWLYLFLLLPK